MKPTRTRHVVLWLTVIAYMITYMDRVVIANAAPKIREDLNISNVTMGYILSAFYVGYSPFSIPGGWLGDKIGARRALTLIVTWWSIFTSLTAASWNAISMGIFRILFGMGEAGAFPTATRSLSRWMLPTERAYAQGITHAGSRLGATITPVLVVWIMAHYGWRSTFVVFGVLGVLWAAVWYFYYRDTPEEHSGVNKAELELIHRGLGGPRPRTSQSVPWRGIFTSNTVLLLSAMYFLYGLCFTFFLAWFPTYLKDHRGMTLTKMGIYSSLPFLAGTLGNLFGGLVSDFLAHRTQNLKWSRRGVAVFGFVWAAAGIVPAALTADPEACVAYTCLGMLGLELTVAVSWAIPLDVGGDFAGSVSAVMNMCGNMGGLISPVLIAYLADRYGWDVPFLLIAIFCVMAAILCLRIDATRKIFANPQAIPVEG